MTFAAAQTSQWITTGLSAGSEGVHGHDAWHLVAVTGGAMQQEVGGRRRDLVAGHCRLSAPGTPHRIAVGSDPLRCRLLVLPDRIAPDIARRASNLFTDDPFLFAELTRPDDGMGEWSRQIDRDLRLRAALARFTAQAEGFMLGEPPSWLTEADARLSAGLGPLDEVARHVGFTREHFSRQFVRQRGCSPGTYRRMRRLGSALDQIRDTGAPLAALACDLGFADQSHLTRSVVAFTGRSPASFRRHALAPDQLRIRLVA